MELTKKMLEERLQALLKRREGLVQELFVVKGSILEVNDMLVKLNEKEKPVETKKK